MELAGLIERRIQNFFGYGSLSAPVWFAGMEEGLGNPGDVEQQLTVRFRAADGKATIDMRSDAMREVEGHMKWFVPGGRIQPTWKYPIALYLYLKHRRPADKEEIRDYQTMILGDIARKESAAVELMPLPARKADESSWPYAHAGVQGLGSRREYLKTYKAMRIAKLRDLINTHKPELIIFYSLGYRKDWEEVMGVISVEMTEQFFFGRCEGTAFAIIPQSSMPGMSYDRLHSFAKRILPKVSL